MKRFVLLMFLLPLFQTVAGQTHTLTTCSGVTFNFSEVSEPPGTTYTWLLPTGTGFSGGVSSTTPKVRLTDQLINNSLVDVQANYIINTSTNNSYTLQVIVKPVPVINTIANQTLCHGTNFGGIVLSTNIPGSIITWQNTVPSIGLATSGSSTIQAFSPTNISYAPITSQVEVSAFSNGCSAFSKTFSITVNPIPQMTSVSNIEICGGLYPSVTFDAPFYIGTNFVWTNSNPANNIPFSGTGQINTYLVDNFSNVPISSNIEVRPDFFGCIGLPKTFTLKVKSTPLVTNPGNLVKCAGNPIGPIQFSGSFMPNTEYQWQRTGSDIGITLSNGVGDIASFTTTNNNSNIPITSYIVVRPFSNSCYGPSINFSIQVNPIPKVFQIPDQLNCEYLPTSAVNFSGNVPNTVFNWTNSNGAIGLASSGTGDIGVFTNSNPSNSNITGVILVTPMSNACTGLPISFSYTVKAAPDFLQPPSQSICNGALTDPVNFVLTAMGGAVFSWSRTNTVIGTMPVSGMGNISSYTGINIQGVPIQTVFTVTPFSNGCNGPLKTFQLTINPTPTVTVIPSGSQVICSGLSTSIVFTGSPVGNTIYNWTNDNSLIGIGLTGSGSIGTFITTNSSGIPITASLKVTPISNSCEGTPLEFSIIVKPTPVVNPVPSATFCSGFSSSAIILSGSIVGGTEYNWTNNNTNTGLALPFGAGTVPSFTTSNNSGVPITSLFTVTPFSNGCSGFPQTFSYQVNPIPSINPVIDRVVCSGTLTSIAFNGSVVTNTLFNWSNDNVAIGIGFSNVTAGNSLSFTAINISNLPISGKFLVTPISNSCSGTPISFSILVQPAVSVNGIPDQVKCNGTLTDNISFSGSNAANTIYSWTQSSNLIGFSALSGTGNITAFTTNTGANSLPIVAVFTVTPMSNSCYGSSKSFSIVVNPVPSVNALSSVTYCSGTPANLVFTGSPVPQTLYQWTNSNPAISLAASGLGSINGVTITNGSNLRVSANIIVTPVSNSCYGTPISFSILVQPAVSVNGIPDQVKCNGTLTDNISFSGSNAANTIYSWMQSGNLIGLSATSGTGDITAFTTNTGGSFLPIVSVFTVTPMSNSCVGSSISFSIVVNPIPSVNALTSVTYCSGTPANLVFTGSPVPQTLYQWSNSNPGIGLAASGLGSINGVTITNGSNLRVSANIIVKPVSNSCYGTPISFSILVQPAVSVNGIPDQVKCNGTLTDNISFSGSNAANTIYSWMQSGNLIGLSATSGTGDITAFTTNTGGSFLPIVSVFTVTPMSNSCVGSSISFSIVVNPIPSVNALTSVTNCSGTPANLVFTGSPVPQTLYQWTNSNPAISLAASGLGSINGVTITNGSNLRVSANIIVTPVSNSCYGTPISFSILVQPAVSVNRIPDQVKCNGTLTDNISFSGSNAANTIYSWMQSGNLIGLSATSGSGDITAFTTNTGGSFLPIVSVFTVTPMSNSCYGSSISFSIVVNPVPSVNALSSVTYCSGTPANLVFTGSPVPQTLYQWTNSNPAISLAASGLGSINGVTITNGSNLSVAANIIVTPVSNSCYGTPISFSILVQPAVSVNGIPDQVKCNGTLTDNISFSGSNAANTIYSWMQSGNLIGLSATSGTGDIPAFTTNTGGSFLPIVSVFTVTPMSNTCYGSSISFSIVVNPVPSVNALSSVTYCSGTPANLVFTGSPVPQTLYQWTNSNTAISLAASGLGSINGVTITNGSNLRVSANIIVTPVSNSCYGTPISFSILVQPAVSVNGIPDQVKCNGTLTDNISFSGSNAANTIYSWMQSGNLIGLSATSGTGDIPAFTTNTGGSFLQIVSVFTVTPMSNSCVGNSISFSIVVNPVPSVNALSSVTYCSGTPANLVFTGSPVPHTIYQWTNSNPSIGLAASGVGSINGVNITNGSNLRISANIIVTPVSNSCYGTPISFSIIVQPAVSVNGIPDQVKCNGTLTDNISFSGSNAANTIYSWTQSSNLIGLSATSGTGDIPAFTTNTGGAFLPIVSVFTVTPMSNSCVGNSISFSIVVNPVPSVNALSSVTYCSGTPANLVFTGSPVPQTLYQWTNSNPANSLAASGLGSINGVTITNGSNLSVAANIIVTPVSNSCYGTPISFSILVQPALSVNGIPDQVKCNGTLTDNISFSGSNAANTIYSWMQSGNLIGLSATSGTGDIPAFTTNTGGSFLPIVSVFTVTPMSNNCYGSSISFSIVVNPVPSVNALSSVTYCSGTPANLVFTGSPVPLTLYQWTNSNPVIGLAASGVGSINGITLTNGSNVPVSTNIIVTPFSNTCIGSPTSFKITINPIPSINAIPDQAVCNNFQVQSVYFDGSPVFGTSFQWVRTDIPIGAIALSGTGNIAAFTGQNIGNVPITSLFTVTPVSNSCSGNSISFSITINPLPTVDPVSGLINCAGSLTGDIPITGSSMANTRFLWTNDNTSIGLAANGEGSINSFTLTNESNVSITANIIVTPLSNSCSGNPTSFQIIVKPNPTINAITPIEACNGTTIPTIQFTGSSISGTIFNWTNNNTNTGIPSNSGSGNISAFTATNVGNVPIISTIGVVASYNGCSSLTETFTIRINPTPNIISIPNQIFCGNTLTDPIQFTGPALAGTQFNWTNNNPLIGLPASGTGNINSFTTTNNSILPITANITVSPYSNSCYGSPATFSIVLKPTPVINSIVSQILCANTNTQPINFGGSTMGGIQFNWTNDNPSIGLLSTGSGNINSFLTTNSYNFPITANISVTAFTNGCTSKPVISTILVNPIPTISALPNQLVCATQPINEIVFSGFTILGTIYQWTNNNTLIGLTTSGTGNIPAFTAVNPSDLPISSLITVTPFSNNCSGIPTNIVITVKPTPTINPVNNQFFCRNTVTQPILFTGSIIPSTVYNWTQSNNEIGLLPTSGSGNIPSFTAQNNSNISIKSTITVSPFTNGCTGIPVSFDVNVNPLLIVNPVPDIIICGNEQLSPIQFSGSSVTGVEYRWVNDNTSTGINSSGIGTIVAFSVTNNYTVPIQSKITVTAFSNNCSGNSVSFTITVKPSPKIDPISSQVICGNTQSQPIIFKGSPLAGTEYRWSASFVGIGIESATGTGNINPFTAVTNAVVPVTCQFTVVPFTNNCSGAHTTFSITVNPIPTINSIPDIIQCGNVSTNLIQFQGSIVQGTIYQWTNNNISIGLGSSGSGNIASFTASNSSNIPASALITVTPFSNGCGGASKQFTITIKSIPSVQTVADQIICGGKATQLVTFNGSPISNTQYDWSASNGLTGLPTVTGRDSISSFTTVNSTNVPISTNITVTPFSNGCSGIPMSFSYRVNPIPSVLPINNQIICGNTLTAPVLFTGSTVGNTVYEWNNSNQSIGLPSTGVGNINSFTPTNTLNIPVSAIITVTPVSNSCYGTSISFSIVNRPIPILESIPNQTICSGFNTNTIQFTSSVLNTTHSWTNNNPTLGLPFVSGNGNIGSFNSINSGVLPGYMKITVIPLANGCLGISKSFTITVNPKPQLVSSTIPTGICNNTIFSYTLQSATPETNFLWQRIANPTINGNTTSGGLTEFIYETLNSTNTISNSVVYAISITAYGCSNAQTISVSVTPTPILSSPNSIQAICSGTSINYSPQTATPNTFINWSRSLTPGITNPATSGINTISEFLFNNTNLAINVNYNLTLTSAGCSNSQTVTVSVLPTPSISMQSFSICSGGTINFTPINTADSTQLSWELPVIIPNGTLIGAQNSASWRRSFSQSLINTTSQVAYAVYSVKTIANNCVGNSFTVTLQVLPSAVINSVTLSAICSGSNIVYIPPNVSSETRYKWAIPDQIPKNSLSGATTGNNEVAFTQTLFTLNNQKDTAIYTVQASSANCIGTTFTITVYINPTPFVNSITDTVCSGEKYTFLPQKIPAGTQYTWSIPAIQPLGSVSGTTSQNSPINIFSQVPLNNGTQFASLNYQVNAIFENCISQPFTVNLAVTRPIPIIAIINRTTCSGIRIDVTPQNMPTGISYSWDVPKNSNGKILGGSASSGKQSSIQFLLTNSSNLLDSIQYYILPQLDNCIGQSFTTNISVTPPPIATVIATAPASISTSGSRYICNNVNDSITIEFTGKAPFNFTFSDNGKVGQKNKITANRYTLILPPAGSGVTERNIQIYRISDSNCTNNHDTLQIYYEVKGLPSGKIESLHKNYICNGILDTLHVITTDSMVYQWKRNGVNISGAIGDSLFTNIAGLYQVILTDGFGCSDTTLNSIRLIANKIPIIKFKQDIQCINSLITFTNQTDTLLTGPLSWKWDFGNGLTSNTYHAKTSYQVSGNYQLIVTATQENCGDFPPPLLDSIIQIASPIEAVDSLNVKATKNQNTPISARFIPNYKYEWRTLAGTTAGLKNANTYATIFNYAESVRYGIKLTSPQGCVTVDSMWVRVFNADVIDIFVPKTFTPNNDGKNDKIFPYLTPGIKTFNYFKIYNRFGNILFLTKDYSQGWDGRLNGVNQPMGIYFWEVSYIDANNVQQSKFGQFLISR